MTRISGAKLFLVILVLTTIIVACGKEIVLVVATPTLGPTPTPIIIEKEVIKEVQVVATPTLGPTPTPIIIEKEVIKEVEVQIIVTPTPGPTTAPIVVEREVIKQVSGSREDPIPIRSSVNLSDGWRVSVVSVTADATGLVLAENPFNDPPAPGNTFFIATIEASYLGPGSSTLNGSFRFRVVGAGAVSYSTFENSCGVIPSDLPDPEVFTDGTITGNLCWGVRSSDVGSLVMFDSPFLGSLDPSERIYMSLVP